MSRDVDALADTDFDLFVVGAGAVGAWVAREASRAGLATALVEGEDYGGADSSATLKVLHGGFRYLEGLDAGRFLRSRRAVGAWRDLAPNLVADLPVLVPITGRGLSRWLPMRAASLVEHALNRLSAIRAAGSALPPARVATSGEVSELAPQLLPLAREGGLVFHDGVMYSPERMVLTAVRDARSRGAVTVNHCEVEDLRRDDEGFVVRCRDRLASRSVDVRARSVVNATGAEADRLLERWEIEDRTPIVGRLRALNLVLEEARLEAALAIPARPLSGTPEERSAERHLFVLPWRNRTLLGTAYGPLDGDRTCPSDDELAESLLSDVDRALPGHAFGRDRVVRSYGGWIPLVEEGGERRALESPVLVRHVSDGRSQLLTPVTEKYTTAPLLARRVVRELLEPIGSGGASETGVVAGDFATGAGPEDEEEERGCGRVDDDRELYRRLPPDVRRHLERFYGNGARRLVRYRTADPAWDERLVPGEPTIRAQVHHAVREEHARTPEDVVQRRLELGPRGLPVESAARLARELLRDLPPRGNLRGSG